MDTVIYEKRAPIASITINRPQVMNACDPPTTDYIYECEQNFDQDPDLKVLILTGTGDRAFCTGMDLKAAAARIAAGGPVSNVVPPYMKTGKITIAAVNGYAVAGGLERALACDIRIASENAQFGCFEIRRGLRDQEHTVANLPDERCEVLFCISVVASEAHVEDVDPGIECSVQERVLPEEHERRAASEYQTAGVKARASKLAVAHLRPGGLSPASLPSCVDRGPSISRAQERPAADAQHCEVLNEPTAAHRSRVASASHAGPQTLLGRVSIGNSSSPPRTQG